MKVHNLVAIISMAMGMAVGMGIQRQPGWNSRPLQILYSAAVAGVVTLVVFFVLRGIVLMREKKEKAASKKEE